LALAWEMMNKSSLARTVGGQKPVAGHGALLVARHRMPEAGRATQRPRHASSPAIAMDIVTLVTDMEQAVTHLQESPESVAGCLKNAPGAPS